jgi:hypothetical protein
VNPVLLQIGMLLGVLLVVGGIILALVTGLDPIYGSLGALIAAAGGATTWYCQRQSPTPTESSGGMHERSVQKPIDAPSRSKFDKKI